MKERSFEREPYSVAISIPASVDTVFIMHHRDGTEAAALVPIAEYRRLRNVDGVARWRSVSTGPEGGGPWRSVSTGPEGGTS